MRIRFIHLGKWAPALVIAVAAALYGACGGSVILEEGTGGSGGSGGEGSSSQVSTTSIAGTTGPSTGVSVGTGTMECVNCAEHLTENMGVLCPESEVYYKQLFTCICAEQCIPQCGSNVCSGAQATDDCVHCITTMCEVEFNQCANDI